MLRYFEDDGISLFAHRGGARRWPENTMRSFSEAVALGYTRIETDAHVTRDGELVLFHDATLERTTDGEGAIARRTLAELRQLDAGYRFEEDSGAPFRGQGLQIPTVQEALEAFPDVRFNIELKAADPRLTWGMIELIEYLEAHDRVLVAAAVDAVGERFRAEAKKRASKKIATSAGLKGVTKFWAASRMGQVADVPFDALQVPPSYYGLRVVDEKLLSAAKRGGLKVHVWTIDEPEEMRRLEALGVDGIMTDLPKVLMETIGQ